MGQQDWMDLVGHGSNWSSVSLDRLHGWVVGDQVPGISWVMSQKRWMGHVSRVNQQEPSHCVLLSTQHIRLSGPVSTWMGDLCGRVNHLGM